MNSDNIIKSLVKSIDVLKVVQSKDGISLNELHQRTSIPKPTLCRILATFEHCHVVRKSMIDQLYRSNYTLGTSGELSSRSILISIAGEVLDDLCKRLVWPSDLLVREGLYMEVAETNRLSSPLSVNRDSLGDRVNMLYSAVGRVYLAYCSEEERTTLVNALKRSTDPFYRKANDQAWLDEVLADTVKKGYGVRDNSFRSLKKDEPAQQDGLSAIAVPVIINRDVVGCINMLWPSRLYTESDFAKMHLSDLKDAAGEIAQKSLSLLQNTSAK